MTGSSSRRCSSVPYDSSDGRELAVGDPVRGDRRAVRQQFLGDHVAVQMTQPAAAVLGRDGQADEPRVARRAEKSASHLASQESTAGSQPNSRAVGGQELPDRRP